MWGTPLSWAQVAKDERDLRESYRNPPLDGNTEVGLGDDIEDIDSGDMLDWLRFYGDWKASNFAASLMEYWDEYDEITDNQEEALQKVYAYQVKARRVRASKLARDNRNLQFIKDNYPRYDPTKDPIMMVKK